ncbi:hypothetical protein FRC10_010516 [Ceratobasidium sp. 414]|nr:hypothetical protein FRC10_010516 [Ceratobasidium sp. 414]
MDVGSDYGSGDRPPERYSDPPIGYTSVRRHPARPPRPPVDVHQSEEDELSRDGDAEDSQQDGRRMDGVLLNQIQSRIQTLLPMLTSTSRTGFSLLAATDPHAYASSSREGNARFARAPSSSGHTRTRGGAPAMSAHDPPRGAPQRRDSLVTASESSMVSAASPSVGLDQRHHSIQSDTPGERSDAPYRRPGKHRVGESPTPEEYMALPPEAKKKVDNRLSARRSRAKRKEHVHVLTAQITEQQNTIEMLRIENKQLNDHIANLSRAGYSLHPTFQPGLVPHHPHPSPHLRHPPHIHPGARHLPPAPHPTLPPIPPSPRRSHVVPSPTLSAHPSLASSSGLVAAVAPPTGPGHVPILAHASLAGRSEASGSFIQGGPRYESPGRGTKREVEDERDDRLRSRMRYASPERSNWEHGSEGRRLSHSSYRSPPRHQSHHHAGHDQTRSPSPSRARWRDLPPSLAAAQYSAGRPLDYDPAEDVGDGRTPIQISGHGSISDRLATLIRVHKRAIMTYRATRQGELSEREERMEGVLGAAEAIGKEVEELTEEFRTEIKLGETPERTFKLDGDNDLTT